MGHRPHERYAVAAFELRPEWAVADERQRPFLDLLEGVREPHDVLALAKRAHAEETRRRIWWWLDAKPLEVDAAVHDLDLAACVRDLRLELATEVVGDGNDGGCAPDDEAGR